MALTRTRVIVLAALLALVALVGAGVVVLTSGDEPVIQLEAARNVLKIEAAGIDHVGWPEMGVIVNGQDIGSVTIDSQQRKTFSIDVPNNIDPISTILLTFTNQSYCQNQGTAGECTLRSIIFRGLYLNDKKLEGGVVSGEKNTVYSLQTATGGITWQVAE